MKPQDPHGIPQGPDTRAEALAVDILGFLAADPTRLARFFDLTGLSPASLRQSATSPRFATGLVEYLCADDRLLLAFAHETGTDPAAIEGLRRALSPMDGTGDPS